MAVLAVKSAWHAFYFEIKWNKSLVLLPRTLFRARWFFFSLEGNQYIQSVWLARNQKGHVQPSKRKFVPLSHFLQLVIRYMLFPSQAADTLAFSTAECEWFFFWFYTFTFSLRECVQSNMNVMGPSLRVVESKKTCCWSSLGTKNKTAVICKLWRVYKDNLSHFN